MLTEYNLLSLVSLKFDIMEIKSLKQRVRFTPPADYEILPPLRELRTAFTFC